MSTASSRDRLAKLENHRRFLDWFVWYRFGETLTADELATYARDGQLPNPLPNRPSRLDGLDRDSLIKCWEKDEQVLGGRSREELSFYAVQGFWPERRGRLHYSVHDGNLRVEWQNAQEKEALDQELRSQDKGCENKTSEETANGK